MTPSKGKLVALVAVLLGISTLGVAGFAFGVRLIEEYYIRQLELRDPLARTAAAEKLGDMRSVRAVPAILEAAIRGDLKPSVASETIGKVGRPSVEHLLKEYNKRDGDSMRQHFAREALEAISRSEGLGRNVEAFLLKVKEESKPGLPLHRATIDLLPKVEPFQSQTEKPPTDQAFP